MPKPRQGETESQFMSRCIPMVEGEGKPHDQAIAICSSLWSNRNKGVTMKFKDPITKFFQSEVKAFNDDDLTIEHFISTETPDRSDDIMRADGMVMDGVPVVLKAHGFDVDTGSEPIAKPLSIGIGVNKNGVKGIVVKTQYFDGRKLTPPDNTGQRLYLKAKEGVMPYWSVRFRGIEGEPRGSKGGIDFTKWSLLEYSQVGVPDNIEASVIKDMEKEELTKIIDKRIDFGLQKENVEEPEEITLVEKLIKTISESGFTVEQVKEAFKIDKSVEFEELPTEQVEPILKLYNMRVRLKSIADRVAEDLPWEAMRTIWFGFLDELYASDGSDKVVKAIIKEMLELITPHAHAFAQATNTGEMTEIKSLIEKLSYDVKEDTVDPPPVSSITKNKSAENVILKLKPSPKSSKLPISKEELKSFVSEAVKEEFQSSIQKMRGKID